MILWRISNHSSLSGDGGLRASGRWHTRGQRVVYCAENPATALLEILVHLEVDVRDLPVNYQLLKIHAPDSLAVHEIALEDLPGDWQGKPYETRAIGDEWLTTKTAPLLRVPSALIPETFNVLLNPGHPDATKVKVARITEHVVDPRLLR